MVNAVFIHKEGSGYDDRPDTQYDFPKTYLSRVERTVGDWIVYYAPRAVGPDGDPMCYTGLARVERVVPHPSKPGNFLALMERGSYQQMPDPVPRMVGGTILESALRLPGNRLMSGGNANSAVRILARGELDRILDFGFASVPDPDAADVAIAPNDLTEPQVPFRRRIIERLDRRPYRDAAFRHRVRQAYDNRCAISGLALRNGGPEVQAAHIKPVSAGGPDHVGNGLALSATLHWMFDHRLISVAEDGRILVSHNRVPAEDARRLFLPDQRLRPPRRPRDGPNPEFLRWHREQWFDAQ